MTPHLGESLAGLVVVVQLLLHLGQQLHEASALPTSHMGQRVGWVVGGVWKAQWHTPDTGHVENAKKDLDMVDNLNVGKKCLRV